MVIRVQYVLDINRLLRADIAHLRGEHHCPLYTCKFTFYKKERQKIFIQRLF